VYGKLLVSGTYEEREKGEEVNRAWASTRITKFTDYM
jgi:hypothetical protein